MVYRFGRIDVSGRVGDRAIVGVLGWQPGDRLTLTAAAGVVIARRDPAGLAADSTDVLLMAADHALRRDDLIALGPRRRRARGPDRRRRGPARVT